MKRKWIYLAAALAVSAGVFEFAGWFRAETNKAESCRYLRKANTSPDPRWPRLGEMLTANSLMRGMCHERDVAKGIEMFERLIAEGAGDYMAVHYYMALKHAGDEARMARWLDPAAAAHRLDRFAMLEVLPRLQDVPEEIQDRSAWMFAATNSDRLDEVSLVVHGMMARPFASRSAEMRVLERALLNLRRLDPVEGAFQTAIAMANGFVTRSDPAERLELLTEASTCGHVRAIVVRARQWLDGELDAPASEVPDIVAKLAVLKRFGGIDPALLATAIAKSGLTLAAAMNGRTPESYRDAMLSRCTAKFGGAVAFRLPD